MASLVDLPEIVGFFSYSREDDEAFRRALSALRLVISHELSARLGRSKGTFRLWQDREAIAPGEQWEAKIKSAIAQSVFFIPIVTPRAINSAFCRSEFEAFLDREKELERSDLVFPVLYIDVPALNDQIRVRDDMRLSIIAARQYVDWRDIRKYDVDYIDVREAVQQFCEKIVDALSKSWESPEERREREAAEARRRAEEERREAEEAEKRRQEEQRLWAEEAEQRRLVEQRLKAEEAERRRLEEQRLKAAEEAEQRRLEEQRLNAEEAEQSRLEEQPLQAEGSEQRRLEQQRLRAEEAEKRRLEEQRLKAEEAEKRRRDSWLEYEKEKRRRERRADRIPVSLDVLTNMAVLYFFNLLLYSIGSKSITGINNINWFIVYFILTNTVYLAFSIINSYVRIKEEFNQVKIVIDWLRLCISAV